MIPGCYRRFEGLFAAVAAVVCILALPLSASAKEASPQIAEGLVYLPQGAVEGSIDGVTVRVDCLLNMPYDFPRIFAVNQYEWKDFLEATKDSARGSSRYEDADEWFKKDSMGLRWVGPFSNPEGTVGVWAFYVTVKNDSAEPFDMSRARISLTSKEDGKVYPPALSPNWHSDWILTADRTFEAGRKKGLLHVKYPIGFASSFFYGFRFKDWDKISANKLVVAPGGSGGGILLFEGQTGTSAVKLSIAGLADGKPEGLSIEFKKDWQRYVLDPASGRWKLSDQPSLSAEDPALSKRAPRTTELVVAYPNFTDPDLQHAAHHFKDELEKKLKAVGGLRVASSYKVDGSEPMGVPALVTDGVRYTLTMDLVSKTVDIEDDQGMKGLNGRIDLAMRITKAGSQETLWENKAWRAGNNWPTDENMEITRNGKLDRSQGLYSLVNYMITQAAVDVANAFPTRAALVEGSGGAILLGAGLEDGARAKMEFDVYPAEAGIALTGPLPTEARKAKRRGELELTVCGGTTSEFKPKSKAALAAGDIAVEKTRKKSIFEN